MASAPRSSGRANPIVAQRRGLTNDRMQRRLIDELITRHTPSLTKFPPPRRCAHLALVRDGSHEWLVSREEIVVRTPDAGRAEPILRRAGFTDRVDGRLVTRFGRTSQGPTSVEDAVRRARRAGIDAGPNLVHTTGQMRMKGASTPAAAPRRIGTRPDSTGGRGVKIAVIDTGIWADTAKRGDGWLDGIEVTEENTDPLDAFSAQGPGSNGLLDWGAGHGTFVAGVIRQVAPAADVVVYQALDSAGLGTDAEVAEAIVAAGEDGADIVHCSFAGPAFEGVPPIALTEAMRLLAPRVLVVAAAGNDGNTTPLYPAAFKRVVAVGALTADGKPSVFSSRGWWVDASTLGEGIVSTFVDGTEEPLVKRDPTVWKGRRPNALWSGTSFAAPQVTGAVAVELSRLRRRSKTKEASARDAYERLVAGAEQVPDFGARLPGLVGA
jgi:thermitase